MDHSKSAAASHPLLDCDSHPRFLYPSRFVSMLALTTLSLCCRMEYDYSAYIAGDAPTQDVFIAIETARALDAEARAKVTPRSLVCLCSLSVTVPHRRG